MAFETITFQLNSYGQGIAFLTWIGIFPAEHFDPVGSQCFGVASRHIKNLYSHRNITQFPSN